MGAAVWVSGLEGAGFGVIHARGSSHSFHCVALSRPCRRSFHYRGFLRMSGIMVCCNVSLAVAVTIG